MKEKNFTITENTKPQDVKKIRDIYTNYLRVMLKCAEDQAYFVEFQKNTRDILVNEVGMTIPEGVPIVLDDNVRWASLVLNAKGADGSNYVVKEMELGIKAYETWADGELEASITQLTHEACVEVDIKAEFKNFTPAIRIPFIDVTKDLLGEISFNKKTEIVLTCC